MRFLLGGMLLCVAGVTATGGEDKEDPASYYPITPGSTWHYGGDFAGRAGEISATIAKIEKIDGVNLARLDVLVQGKVISSEHIDVNAKGIFRQRIQGMEITPPLCLLRFPIKEGDSWSGDFKAGTDKATFSTDVAKKRETVEVPGGKFRTVKVTLDTEEASGQKVKAIYWFAPKVGIVKQEVRIGENTITLELKKFEAGKTEKKKKD